MTIATATSSTPSRSATAPSAKATASACALAVLTGLCATLALLPILQRVLPALPISIAVGIAFYFSSCGMLDPMADAAAVRHVFL